MIVYALLDPRTHRIRYIGKSKNGLLRPLSHQAYGHSPALHAWLRDLSACKCEYGVLILAEATTTDQLAMLEAHWITVAHRFGWPLTNKARPKDTLPDAEMPPGKKWSVRDWRRDPTVRARLEEAREKRPASRAHKPNPVPADFQGSLLALLPKRKT